MNAINHERSFEMIQNHPLFAGLSSNDLDDLLARCEFKQYEKSVKSNYFREPEEGLLLILKGTTEVYIDSEDGTSVVLEVIQEGHIIGFSNLAYYFGDVQRPLEKHHLEMEVLGGSYCLQIPFSVVKERLIDVEVRDFILRKMSNRLANVYSLLGEQVRLQDEWGESEPYVRRVRDFMNHPVISVREEAVVQNVAQLMIEKKISSVMVVDEANQLLGIVTEKDLVERVVAKGLKGNMFAKDIMTVDPHTITPEDYYYEALTAFYKYGVKHLPVVENGEPVGIVTFVTLMSKRDRDSMSILKTIEESSFENLPVVKNAIYDVLSSLIDDEISTIHTLEIITKFYDRLAKHCVKLAVKSLEQKGHGRPPVAFTWYQMGSGARGEQFMLTDQDHFLVYEDVSDVLLEHTSNYFAMLGEEIVVHLEQAGYTRCKGKMMSNEPHWRGTMSEWRQRLRTWALKSTDEHILLGYNFLSFRFLFGDMSLNDAFMEMVTRQLKVSQTFLYYMAQQEREKPIPPLNPSLLGRFKGKGKRETIDIKMHALFPMHHCLQILGVHKNIINATPLQLLDGLVEKQEFTTEFAEDIRHAYEVALSTRIHLSWQKHLRNEKITTAINFSSLRKWERSELRTMLDTARALQAHLLSKL